MSERFANYLIIGNSAAGVAAAERIRELDADGSVLVVSREPHAAYGRPLISYLVEGKTSLDRLDLKEKGFYESRGIETLLGAQFEVVSLDAEAHEAFLACGEKVRYGKCLLATGSVPFVPPIEGISGRDNVFTFLSLDDALAAQAAVDEARVCAHAAGRACRVLVIGGGLIGLKAAEAFCHHADDVVVLELAERILPAVLDNEAAALLARMLDHHGISCRPGVSISELRGEGPCATTALLTTGEELDCDVVVAAVGVRPNSALAVQAGAEQGRGLVCGPDLQTSRPDVYAAGDVVQVTDVLDGSQRPLALWPNAVRQGKIAGSFMAGARDAEPFEGGFAVNAVDFFDVSLLTAGIINPPEDAGCEVRTASEGDSYAKFVTKDGLLVGYILLNRPENAGIYTALIERRVPLAALDAGLFDRAPLNLDFSAEARWERLHALCPFGRDGKEEA